MMDKADIPFLSVSRLSELIKRRQVSPVEVVERYLERIDRLNNRLYAYLTVYRDQAVEAARVLERELARGAYRGPFHGVPVAVKDQLNTAGIRTTCGTPIFNDVVPDADATVIAKLKAAGAILLGKLNMTEFGTTSVSHAFDTARNPWDLERFTGGSSSGSGGATAAWCGVVGLRPTWGRVSRHGLRPGMWSMDTIGPLARTVEDCALTLQAIAGHDPHDAYTWEVPVPDYRAALDHADVLVMPTMGSAAPKIEPDPIIDSKERSTRNRAGLTTAFSLASAPALSLCCGFTSENLPIGLQIGGKPFAEQTVLNVAYAYQHVTDWHRRRPPI
jgi:aspartyl-tRNA(Asn)/glutamyl-tRNA(Gln) amidotransferase subunit A